MNGNVYLVEKSYFKVGNDSKVVQKIYCIRQSKESCQDKRSKKRKCIERIAKINIDTLTWE